MVDMNEAAKHRIGWIFEQLRILRESISDLERMERREVSSLRGHQTVDSKETLHLSFQQLQDLIVCMEETLAALAEASGNGRR